MTINFQNDSSTLVLNERIITDLVEGDTMTLTPVNEKTFRNNDAKSVSIGNRVDGGVHDLTIPVVKNSEDDIWFNNAMNQSTPVVFEGSLKELYNRDGTDFVSSWLLEAGSFTVRPTDTRNNQDGNAIMEYTIQLRNATRLL